MSVGTLISEEEYLHTGYEPDCDFEDGVLIERNVGTKDHGRLQAKLFAYFYKQEESWNVHAFVEQRIRIRAGKYMVPDVCVVVGPEPAEQVFSVPPLLVIEILSPADRPMRVYAKVRQWLQFGVPYVWVIDPETQESELHHGQQVTTIEDRVLRIPETPIEVPLRLL